MSRNLCRTDCYFCEAHVTLVEEPRSAVKEDCGVYFPQFEGMLVANAECPTCCAKYLAWVANIPHSSFEPDPERPFGDLSFRSTFNDEPSEDDLPKHRIAWFPVRIGLWGEKP